MLRVQDAKSNLFISYCVLTLVFTTVAYYFKGFLALSIDINPLVKILSPIIVIYGIYNHISAKKHLGSQWHDTPVIFENHKLITDGPYSLVRHPIYFSIILYALSAFLFRGSYFMLLLFIFTFIAVVIKAKLEELLLLNNFGDEYKNYSKRVSFILPIKIFFIKKLKKGGISQ